jgi:hypothetical protein
VAAPIRIGMLDAREASDLVQALAARGLIGRPVGEVGRQWVEVHEAHEETRRLLSDVTNAVETWLSEREERSLSIEVEGRVRQIEGYGDLRDVLRRRLRARARAQGGDRGTQPPG